MSKQTAGCYFQRWKKNKLESEYENSILSVKFQVSVIYNVSTVALGY